MDSLITRIYDCAMTPAGWPDVLQDIATDAGAFGAMIFDCAWQSAAEHVALRYCSSVYDPDLVQWYVATHNADEVRDQGRFARLSSTGDEVNLIRCDDLYASRAELEGHANMAAMMDFGVHYRAGALLSKDTDAMDRFALQFRQGQGPISEPARLRTQMILAHVAKALSIGRSFQSLEAERIALQLVLEALPLGIALVRLGGAVVMSNSRFDDMADHRGLLSATRTRSFKMAALPLPLQALLSATSAHGHFGARPLREAVFLPDPSSGSVVDPDLTGRQGLFIEATPIAAHPELGRFPGGTFLVSMLDSRTAQDIDPETILRFFPLTDTELAVLALVTRGHTNGEIADIRGRSLETVNSQIKSLIRKSGTRNRTELVRIAVGLSVAALRKTPNP